MANTEEARPTQEEQYERVREEIASLMACVMCGICDSGDLSKEDMSENERQNCYQLAAQILSLIFAEDQEPTIKFLRPMVLHNALHIENRLRDHDEKKGDSWKDCSIDYLKGKLGEEIAEWSTENEPRELLDLMAIAMMLFCRLTGNWSGKPSR